MGLVINKLMLAKAEIDSVIVEDKRIELELNSRMDQMEQQYGTAKNIVEAFGKPIATMKEDGIDISNHTSNHVDEYADVDFDYVITVCDNAKETCPVFIGNVKHRLHIGFDDPADAVGTEEEVMPVYRRVRDEIKKDF